MGPRPYSSIPHVSQLACQSHTYWRDISSDVCVNLQVNKEVAAKKKAKEDAEELIAKCKVHYTLNSYAIERGHSESHLGLRCRAFRVARTTVCSRGTSSVGDRCRDQGGRGRVREGDRAA